MNYMDVSLGTFRENEKMRTYIDVILKTGRISYGHFSQRLEREFSNLHDCKYGVLSNSGTSSLQVALQALKELHKWKEWKEVIVPTTTFVATANIVRHCNLTPVYADVDELTYNIDPIDIARKINRRTVAIIPVHMFGQSARMKIIRDIATTGGLKIIEDSCETMFATHYGEAVGSMGDIGCFSMYVAHLLVAGVGGLSITDNPDLAAKMRSLVNHGLSITQLNVDANFSPMPAVGRRFQFDSLGYSYRITEFEAAVALAQLEDWRDMIRRRRVNAMHLIKRLTKYHSIQLPYTDEGNNHSFMMFPIVLKKTVNGSIVRKTDIVKKLNDAGIQTRDMPSLLRQPVYDFINPSAFPVSDWIEQSGFYVGCHQDLEIEHMDHIADVIEEYLSETKAE